MQIFSDYQITEYLYESSGSLVYRGRHQLTGEPVVLKVLKKRYPSPEEIAWFKREYEIIQTLPIQGIARAYNFDSMHDRWVIILEDFGGKSIDLLHLAGHLSLTQFLPLAIDIVDILSQIHQRNFMHKDINPSNILLNPKTQQVKIIDFGIATMLSRENPTFRNPTLLEGTLAYISPEQTGRMNRAIDYRTDFYSLGVTFYELLTGHLPFHTTDPIELVHCHIAQQPTPIKAVIPEVPPIISDIVMKLMAKTAEDRYQSAHGLKADLVECLHKWQADQQIASFPLGLSDVIDRFQVPQKLYGRDQEIKRLLAAFNRTSQGASELMLLVGYAGIGKSMLVQELYKPITQQRGYFISGKFDQLQRNIPYLPLIQAFRSLIQQLLTESATELAAWREKVLTNIESNGQILIEVIPEIELIIGPQPQVNKLPPQQAQNRFNFVFQNFIRTFAQPEHPLVIFLDDLQWADEPSLRLLHLLMTASEHGYIFVIGAYRDNEVSATHPLHLTLAAIKATNAIVDQITLSPLSLADITHFIDDALYRRVHTVGALAELVQTKTGGNPFFINEFLKALYNEGLLKFDSNCGNWQWDMDRIQAHNLTDNVIELLTAKVQQLPNETQRVLEMAACIGNQFDLHTLIMIHEKSQQEVVSSLWPAIVEGLILPLSDTYKLAGIPIEGMTNVIAISYKFAHDRIQQAIYSLISQAMQQSLHHRIGKLLLSNTAVEERDAKLFTIVNHLNIGRSLITNQPERDKLAQLNLLAGQKAKSATAYQSAYSFLRIGLDLINFRPSERERWLQQYDLTLAMHEEAAEVAYLVGEFEEMNQLSASVLQYARATLDKVRVYEVRISAYTSQNNLLDAIKTALQALALVEVNIPEQPGPTDTMAALQEVQSALAGMQPADLMALAAMVDPVKLAAMRIMTSLGSAAYIVNFEMLILVVCKQVSLSVNYGNSADSAYAYANYGFMLSALMGNIPTGYQFGQLALHLLEQFTNEKLKTRTYALFNYFLRHWTDHFKEIVASFADAYRSGLESGDLEFTALIAYNHCLISYSRGKALTELVQEYAKYGQVIAQFQQETALVWHKITWQAVLNLLGQTEYVCALRGEVYNEDALLPVHRKANDRSSITLLYMHKLMLSYLFQEFQQAYTYANSLQDYTDIMAPSHIAPPIYFYDTLARLAVFGDVNQSEREGILAAVTANQAKMNLWAQHAPMNYLHKFYLIEAERARVLGNDSDARDYYDQAIDLAIENDYLNEEALAHELAGRFYLAKGQTRVAYQYLRDAHYAYQRWGAVAKVNDLEQRYPQLLLHGVAPSLHTAITTTTTSTGQSAAMLDLASVLKASQAISGEIQLDKLLAKLMKVVIENAGAQRGLLLLERKGQWWIEAEGMIEQGTTPDPGTPEVTTQQASAVTTSDRLATTIINYVARTKEHVVLDDATQSNRFAQDPYIRRTQPKSVLCTPLLNQGKLSAILYLENNLTTNAFTQERLEVLNLLSAQAAISLENARLYTHQVALTHGYSRFVPQEILHFLQKESIVDVKLGDQVQQEMAILVSDVRSFTTLSETMTPQENFDFVNAYLGRVSPIVRQHGGLIVKYMGDGMMAVFPTHAEDALRAALDKLRAVELYNDVRRARGYVPLQIGIGIHTGTMMLGTVGEPERMQSDLLSDAVNLTARLEGLAKEYGAALIISQEFLQRLPEPTAYQMRFLGFAQVKGRQALVTIYEIFDADSPEQAAGKAATKADFEAALTLFFDQHFAEAYALFQRVLHHNPQDKAAALYVQRAILALQPPAPLNPVAIASRSQS